jgi:hypothetical protein
MKTGD